ncbi:uncharacterized protein BKCO1_7000221 [Diplodia corticola]|uniref:Integral membrane protein n=1 Tax=Diplodia corticola TaxID=236234 RepID=A0A1J9SAJ4_9PEZI|nr:uncharacterized protein BKCO1_7000221 [Diplodia corticola]OJD37511.1 integral membrane protein [Diplodia corticola]
MYLHLTRHIWDVKPEWTEQALRVNIIFEIMYPVGVTLTKVSICLNYLRIFPMQTFNECFCKGAIVYSACWCISTVVPQIDQYVECPPASNTRDRIRILRDCIDQEAFLIATAALNSFSDLCIFLWPARYVWGMHVPREQRWGLIALFCVGVVISIAGVLRMWFFAIWFHSTDPYWDGVWNYVILAVETNAGFICACLPCCKPLLVRALPCVFGNVNHAERRSPHPPPPHPPPSRGNGNGRRRGGEEEEDAGREGRRGGGGGGEETEAGEGPSPLDPGYWRVVRKKRSSWSLWGWGTASTGMTATLSSTMTGSREDKRRSGAAAQGGTGLLGSVVDGGGNKSDTVILMDDLGGGDTGYCHRTDTVEGEQGSIVLADDEHEPPRLRETGDAATAGAVDLELGFVRRSGRSSPSK